MQEVETKEIQQENNFVERLQEELEEKLYHSSQ
jgi:hypothetical protein